MYISYEYYRIFYHVAKCGNLTKAAEALQNSQPNLTRAIRNLESEIGCPLFSRTNRGMILTPEGEELYRHIQIACTEIEAGEAAVTQSRTLERGNVFLAASEGALRCLLLPVLKKYQEKYPGVHLRISNHSTPQAVAALHETTADFAVITTPVTLSPSLTQTIVKEICEVPVCARAFSDLLGRKVALSELEACPSSRSALGRPPTRSTPPFLPHRASLFNPPSRPRPQTRSFPWRKPASAWASCRRRSSVHPTVCAGLSCKSHSPRVPCAS